MSCPRFTVQISIRDNFSHEAYYMAMPCDEAMSINHRDVEDMKAGPSIGIPLPFDAVVTLIKQRIFRRDLLLEIVGILAKRLVERMEDAEGWHDQSRVEPSRKALRDPHRID